MIRGTIEYNSNNEKVFLPELSCDIFIGVLKPNQQTIDNDSYKIEKDIDCKEGDIVYARLNYYEKTCHLLEVESE